MACIVDIPLGATVTLKVQGSYITGRVISNYGASIAVKVHAEQLILVDNKIIDGVVIEGRESVDAFEITAGIQRVQHQQFVAKLNE